MIPNIELIGHLGKARCKTSYREAGNNTLLLWIDYGHLTHLEKGAGFEVWGNAQQVFEKVNRLVIKYYPRAELVSQANNRTVTYRIGE